MSRLLVLRHCDQQLIDAFTQHPILDQLRSDDCVYMIDGFDFDIFDMLKSNFTVVPRYIVCDQGFACESYLGDYPAIWIPELKYGPQVLIKRMIQDEISPVTVCKTDRVFNFSVNVHRLDRILMMKLVSWFGLESYRYTWRGERNVCDMTPVLQELKKIKTAWATREFRNHILAPVDEFEPCWHDLRIDSPALASTPFDPQLSMKRAWITAIQPLMQHTAVSLICESSNRPQIANFQLTEKTIMPMLAATFPIWIGNYDQAHTLESLGFDVFHDVIDHSYQHKTTLIERCYHAVADNLEILRDLDRARVLRQKHWHRLMRNQDLLLREEIFGKYAGQQAQKLPLSLQQKLVLTHNGCSFPTRISGY